MILDVLVVVTCHSDVVVVIVAIVAVIVILIVIDLGGGQVMCEVM